MPGYVLRHKDISPAQYVMGDFKDGISEWITMDYSKARVFDSEQQALVERRSYGDLAPAFEVVPKLGVA